MTRVFLGLGSNIDAEHNLKLGVDELRRRYGPLDLSRVYRGPAVGFDGDDFLNMVVGFDTDDPPADIHAQIELIHRIAGRERGASPYASRTLDIDLLLYGELVDKHPPVRVPRKDVLEHAFVLRPLAELAPEFRHPETGRTIGEHWAEHRAAADAPCGRLEPISLVL